MEKRKNAWRPSLSIFIEWFGWCFLFARSGLRKSDGEIKPGEVGHWCKCATGSAQTKTLKQLNEKVQESSWGSRSLSEALLTCVIEGISQNKGICGNGVTIFYIHPTKLWFFFSPLLSSQSWPERLAHWMFEDCSLHFWSLFLWHWS